MRKYVYIWIALAVIAMFGLAQQPVSVATVRPVSGRVMSHTNNRTGVVCSLLTPSAGSTRYLRITSEIPTTPSANFVQRFPTSATLHLKTPTGWQSIPFQLQPGAVGLELPVQLWWWSALMIRSVRITASDSAGLLYDSYEFTL